VTAREDNPEERFARREMRKFMADAITELTPELRQVCLLRDVLQYSTQEVAERLGISAMAVRLRLFRAHRKLREELSMAMKPAKPRPANAATRFQMRAVTKTVNVSKEFPSLRLRNALAETRPGSKRGQNVLRLQTLSR